MATSPTSRRRATPAAAPWARRWVRPRCRPCGAGTTDPATASAPSGVDRMTDPFLDVRARREHGNQAYLDTQQADPGPGRGRDRRARPERRLRRAGGLPQGVARPREQPGHRRRPQPGARRGQHAGRPRSTPSRATSRPRRPTSGSALLEHRQRGEHPRRRPRRDQPQHRVGPALRHRRRHPARPARQARDAAVRAHRRRRPGRTRTAASTCSSAVSPWSRASAPAASTIATGVTPTGAADGSPRHLHRHRTRRLDRRAVRGARRGRRCHDHAAQHHASGVPRRARRGRQLAGRPASTPSTPPASTQTAPPAGPFFSLRPAERRRDPERRHHRRRPTIAASSVAGGGLDGGNATAVSGELADAEGDYQRLVNVLRLRGLLGPPARRQPAGADRARSTARVSSSRVSTSTRRW